MIRIFYGDDRKAAQKMVVRELGDGYEVVEAENLTANDMPSVLLGASLFAETRSILIKDLSENKECWETLPKYVADCPHKVVIWETKLDKRSVVYKELSECENVEFKEFKQAEDPDAKKVFDIFEAAMRGDGKTAVKLCEKIETTNDPYLFMGLMVSQAVKKLQFNNSRAPKALKILAAADLDMKSTSLEPWAIVKMALLKIGGM